MLCGCIWCCWFSFVDVVQFSYVKIIIIIIATTTRKTAAAAAPPPLQQQQNYNLRKWVVYILWMITILSLFLIHMLSQAMRWRSYTFSTIQPYSEAEPNEMKWNESVRYISQKPYWSNWDTRRKCVCLKLLFESDPHSSCSNMIISRQFAFDLARHESLGS